MKLRTGSGNTVTNSLTVNLYYWCTAASTKADHLTVHCTYLGVRSTPQASTIATLPMLPSISLPSASACMPAV
eukprot:711-Heterococcus_DN1.PRE.5